MPIYAYKCESCGHQQDILQKVSDPLLTCCPACGKSSFVKQITAAGFQLKGSGWYVTDFRNNGSGAKAKDGHKDAAPGDAASTPAAQSTGGGAASKPAGETASSASAAPAQAGGASSQATSD